ncbi:transcriptional repressor [Hydrotalea sp.]|uniref:Fur family transcriptional regulator n=1 Tax=Hydrotalea sp. TaxID=2881279 RepID=UPI00260C77F1|nr:transcriptional repressor [Hydrotalea sp.]
MTDAINTILKKSSLSVTPGRSAILQLFHQSDGALTHAVIEEKTGDQFDRVTIYRTLQVFVEKGLIHTIPSPDNSILYALCKEDCSEGHHHDNHIHFICDKCNTTYCLDHITTPYIALPNGFKTNQTDVLIKGLCAQCNL